MDCFFKQLVWPSSPVSTQVLGVFNPLLQDGQLQPIQAYAGLKCMAGNSIEFILFGFFLSILKGDKGHLPFLIPKTSITTTSRPQGRSWDWKARRDTASLDCRKSIQVLYCFRNQLGSTLVSLKIAVEPASSLLFSFLPWTTGPTFCPFRGHPVVLLSTTNHPFGLLANLVASLASRKLAWTIFLSMSS